MPDVSEAELWAAGPGPGEPPVFASLRITRIIGRGGQAVVYEAVREHPRQVVAIKVPRPDGDVARRAEHLVREADLLAGLNHPNIVKVLHVASGSCGGRTVPGVVLELIEDARTITEFARHADLSSRQRVELVIKVARAAQHIHERLRAFHRDLKPANILVGRDGEPRIIDLGMAVSGETEQRLLERGSLVGTPDYMAPEQFDRDPAFLTQRTDVYALGVILYELLAGTPPYELAGLTRVEKESAILNRPPRPLPAACVTECPAVGPVVDRALRKERPRSASDPRWATPGVFADELAAAIRTPGGVGAGTAVRRDLWPPALIPLVIVGLATAAGSLYGNSAARALGLTGMFERAAFASVPPAVRGRPLTRTAIVGFQSTDEVRAAADLLASRGRELPGIDPATPRTWRPLYAELLRSLRDSGADAVVFDIVFKVPAEVDALFAEAAAEAPFAIIVGLDIGALSSPSPAPLSAAILRPPVQWGGVSAMFGPEAAWAADLLHERGTQFSRPTLPVRTLASVYFPGATHRFSLSPDGREIRIDADAAHPGVEALARPAGETCRAPVTTCEVVRSPTPEDQSDFGVRDGDRIAQLMIALPEQAQLDAATHTVLSVLSSPPETLRANFNRRAIFVANMTPLAPDRFGHPDGRELWGVCGHAAAYEALITGSGIRSVDPRAQPILALAAAGIPALLFVVGRRRGWIRKIVLPVTLSALALAFGVMGSLFAARWWLWYTAPFPFVAALFVSASLSSLAVLVARLKPVGRPNPETRHAPRSLV